MSLVAELKRRNVVRVAAAYLVVGWLLTEVLTTIYGEEDWEATIEKVDDEDDEAPDTVPTSADTVE